MLESNVEAVMSEPKIQQGGRYPAETCIPARGGRKGISHTLSFK